jgi:hypothetical protein
MARCVPVVPPELLVKANEQIIADREIHGSADIVRSTTLHFAREHHVGELLAVSHRLMALARLVGSGRIGRWTNNVKDWRLLDEALFRAAAKAPLQESEMLRDMQFDPEQFLQIALQEARHKGVA